MAVSAKLKFIVVVKIKANKITGSELDFEGDVEENVKDMISGLKRPLYAFVRERLIEPRQPGSAQVRVLVRFQESTNGRTIEFSVQ
jgi:hypothetical protein